MQKCSAHPLVPFALVKSNSSQGVYSNMTAEIISGTEIRKEILAEIDQEVKDMKAKHG